MNIQEIYDSIDNQYSLYKSEQGADYGICDGLSKILSNLIEEKISFDEPDFMEYFIKLHNITMHRETGILIKNGIKKKYTRDGDKVTIQVIK